VQHARERLDGVRFLNQLESVTSLVGQYVAVAARQYDGQTGETDSHSVNEVDPVHSRHDDIKKNQIEPVLFLSKRRGAFGARVG
jgi:hypothetical protein